MPADHATALVGDAGGADLKASAEEGCCVAGDAAGIHHGDGATQAAENPDLPGDYATALVGEISAAEFHARAGRRVAAMVPALTTVTVSPVSP